MLELVKYEFQKIAGKKVTIIGMITVLAINLFMFSTVITQEVAYEDGKEITGTAAVQFNRNAVEEYHGVITDHEVLDILSRYGVQKFEEEHYNYNSASTFVKLVIKRSSEIPSLKAAFPEIDFPLIFGYSDGWESFLRHISDIMLLLSFLIIIVITPVFSEEYSTQAAAVILTTKHGKKQCIWAKLIASFSFTLLLTILFWLLNFITIGSFFGFSGFDVSIQCAPHGSFANCPWNINFGSYILLMFLFIVIAVITLTAIILIISAFNRSSFIAIILSSILYITPRMVVNLPYHPLIGRIASLFPSQVMNPTGPILYGIQYPLFQYSIDIKYMILVTSVTATILLCIFSYRAFRNYQVR